MDLVEFLGLDTKKQFEVFWENCIFLEHYVDGLEMKYHLYSVFDFYVELTSDVTGKLDPSLNTFLEGPRLDKYRQGDIDFINDVLDEDD